MSLKWKCVAVVPALALLVTGCGGLQASKSISPATFLLPGLMKAEPTQDDPLRDVAPAEKPVEQVARL